MANKEESLGPLRILRQRLEELADNLNIELNNVAFMVGEEAGSPDVAQVVFVLTPDALKTAEELDQKRIDDEFAAMMAGETFIDKGKAVKDDDDLDLWDD